MDKLPRGMQIKVKFNSTSLTVGTSAKEVMVHCVEQLLPRAGAATGAYN